MIRNSFFLLLILAASCNLFKPEQKSESIARVGENYLFKSDIAALIPAGTPKEDSILLVHDFINRWATQKLLIEAAERNLSDSTKREFEGLINQYKIDLYIKEYIEQVVKTTVDTVVSDAELRSYYDANKENFRASGLLVRLRFINVSKENPKFETIRSKFFDFSKKDKKFWDTYALQFKSFAMNDSVWVDMSQVYSKLPFITPDNRDELIVPGKKIEKSENGNVFLVKITDVIDKNQVSPYDYIKPTLREVILNKRKLELIKKFQKEITDDAIKTKDYEIYK